MFAQPVQGTARAQKIRHKGDGRHPSFGGQGPQFLVSEGPAEIVAEGGAHGMAVDDGRAAQPQQIAEGGMAGVGPVQQYTQVVTAADQPPAGRGHAAPFPGPAGIRRGVVPGQAQGPEARGEVFVQQLSVVAQRRGAFHGQEDQAFFRRVRIKLAPIEQQLDAGSLRDICFEQAQHTGKLAAQISGVFFLVDEDREERAVQICTQALKIQMGPALTLQRVVIAQEAHRIVMTVYPHSHLIKTAATGPAAAHQRRSRPPPDRRARC